MNLIDVWDEGERKKEQEIQEFNKLLEDIKKFSECFTEKERKEIRDTIIKAMYNLEGRTQKFNEKYLREELR